MSQAKFSANKAVVLLSGGVDSTTLLYATERNGSLGGAVMCDYGQPAARRELDCALKVVVEWELTHAKLQRHVCVLPVDSSVMRAGVGASGPRVLPGRNLLLVATAAMWAVRWGCWEVLIGATADDHTAYADCRAEWLLHLSAVMHAACGVYVSAPFSTLTKREVVALAKDLNVPLGRTWSCYEPTQTGKQCGMCAACNETRKAGVPIAVPRAQIA